MNSTNHTADEPSELEKAVHLGYPLRLEAQIHHFDLLAHDALALFRRHV